MPVNTIGVNGFIYVKLSAVLVLKDFYKILCIRLKKVDLQKFINKFLKL